MAAPIITCPACTKKFKGKEGLEGKRIKCPLCTTPFVVTAALTGSGGGGAQAKIKKPVAANPSARNAGATWNKEDDNSDPYKLGEFDIRPRCPNCANLMVSEEAVVCVFCGYNTQLRTWGQTIRAHAITPGQHFLHLLPGLIFLLVFIIFMIGLLYFCLVLPRQVVNTWASFFDHESMRMWIIGLTLAFMFAFGSIAMRRLVLNPKPKELEKEVEGTKR